METQQQAVVTCPDPPVDHLEKHGYLFGYPIAHSYSPFLHNSVFDALGLQWGFSLLESTDMNQFLRLIKDPRLYGELDSGPVNATAMLTHLPRLRGNNAIQGGHNTAPGRPHG